MKLPLPIYESIKIGEQGEFDIIVGLDKNLVNQLIEFSNDLSDVELHKNTPDIDRFGSFSAYEKWYEKIRTPFILVHKGTNVLSAIVWLGPRPFGDRSGNWTAVGWRSYNPWRGKGLMKPFANFVIDFYLKHFPDAQLWITAKKENIGSLYLAEALGFKTINSNREEGFLEMVKNANI
jgi:RimJ/RimL family protein N-acetyltransferase